MEGGRLDHGARLRLARPDPDQRRARAAERRRAGLADQHGRGAAPARPAGARPRQREHRHPAARGRAGAPPAAPIRWLGQPIAALSELQRVLVVGSFLRKDHPLLRPAPAPGGEEGRQGDEPARAARRLADADGPEPRSPRRAAGCRRSPTSPPQVGAAKGVAAPAEGKPSDDAKAIAAALAGGTRKAILLGNAAAAASRRCRDRAARPLDRRADRRQLRLAGRRRQRGRRPAGRLRSRARAARAPRACSAARRRSRPAS